MHAMNTFNGYRMVFGADVTDVLAQCQRLQPGIAMTLRPVSAGELALSRHEGQFHTGYVISDGETYSHVWTGITDPDWYRWRQERESEYHADKARSRAGEVVPWRPSVPHPPCRILAVA